MIFFWGANSRRPSKSGESAGNDVEKMCVFAFEGGMAKRVATPECVESFADSTWQVEMG